MKVDVLGVKIDAISKGEVLAAIENNLNHGKSTFIVTPYSESIVAAQNDREFRNVLNSADIALPDGVGILWAAHYLKFHNLLSSLFSIIFNPKSIRDPIPEKISGSLFVWDLAELAAKNNYSIFLLGGYGDTAQLAAASLKSKFPNLKIAETASPVILRYSDLDKLETQNDKLINIINSAHPDFLLVALGPIRQEKWIAKNLPKLPVKLAIGLGGTFDYLASKRLPAPQIWATIGLEWLWRLLTQPRRLGRIAKGVSGLIYHTVKRNRA